MTGYTRADSVNNIADGNIINASDLDGEFDAVQAAFNNSTGHVHDGTAANGAPITKIGPTQDVVASAIALLPKTTATVDVGSSSLKFKDFFFSGAGSVTGTITAGGFSGTVGATTPAAGTFTSLSDSGNLTFTGTGNRITGDFTNATVASRVAFQTSTVNGNTTVNAIPNGTATSSQFITHNATDPGNSSRAGFNVGSTTALFFSDLTGTGTYLPMAFNTGGSERMRIDASGNVGIGTSSPSGSAKLDVTGGNIKLSTSNSIIWALNATTNFIKLYNSGTNGVDISSSGNMTLSTLGASANMIFNTFATERMRIDSSGNVGIGTSSPKGKLDSTTSDNSKGLIVSGSTNLLRVYPYYNFGGNNRGTMLESTNVAESAFGDISISGNTIQFLQGASTERMRIDSSGNVGIGTSSPSTYGRFAVVSGGDFAPAATFLSNSSAVNWARADWKNSNVAYSGIIYQDQSGLFNIRNDGANAIAFLTNGGNERMRINSSGQVGIGTSAPTGQLDVRSAAGVVAQSNLYTGSNAAVVKFNIGQVGAIDWDIGLNATAGNFYIGGLGGSMAEAYKIVRSGLSIDYQTWNTGGAERMRIDSSGNVGIGTTSPAGKIEASSSTQNIILSRSTGSYAAFQRLAPTGQQTYDFYTINSVEVARITGDASYLGFSTGSSSTERMRIDTSGNVLVTSAGGLGYGTGSGGTVTQATSKSTAVTLNKPTGQITMNNAALGAGASVIFLLTNSLLAATDSVIVQPNYGANSQSYAAQVTFSGAGGAYIRVTNISGGSLSEAVTLSFAIIKGATA